MLRARGQRHRRDGADLLDPAVVTDEDCGPLHVSASGHVEHAVGGDLVERVIRTVDRNVPYRAVTASRGKRVRAEPIAALYEQGRVSHAGSFPELEDQMCSFVPDAYDGSPDRVDALVWALSELMLEGKEARIRAL